MRIADQCAACCRPSGRAHSAAARGPGGSPVAAPSLHTVRPLTMTSAMPAAGVFGCSKVARVGDRGGIEQHQIGVGAGRAARRGP